MINNWNNYEPLHQLITRKHPTETLKKMSFHFEHEEIDVQYLASYIWKMSSEPCMGNSKVKVN